VADRIKLTNMVFYAYHGTSPEERKTGHRFEVDVEVYTDLSEAGQSDRLSDTINYTRLYHLTQELFTSRTYNLLEKVAALLADKIKSEFKPERVVVTVRKMIPPIPGNLDHIEVVIEKG
jgi:dihydroneopterin aldolase